MTSEHAQRTETTQLPRPWIVPYEYEVGASRWLNRVMDALGVALHPMLGSISRETVHDLPEPEPYGNQQSKASSPDEASHSLSNRPPELASPLFRSMHITHEWSMSVMEVTEFDVGALLQRVYEAADQVGGQLVFAIFQHISDICEQNGQVVSIEKEDFFDGFIDSIEKLDIDFDVNGNPTTQIAMNPATHAAVSKISPTPEQEERLRIAIERKREAWFAARRRQELPELPQ